MLELDPELKARLVAEQAKDKDGTQPEKPETKRGRLFTVDQLAEIPPPKYMLKPFIRQGGLNVLWGSPGSGKSFLAIDWGLRIATGTPWFDGSRPVQGPVIYNPAEGVAGILPRIRAWEKANEVKAPDTFRVWPEAVNYYRGETEAFEAQVAQLDELPALIVIDTVARSMVGGEENSAKDMGIFIEAAERVANRFGATVLVVHHPDKGGKAERGSGSLRGACEVSAEARLDGDNLEVRWTKDKDAPAFRPWLLRLEKAGESVAVSPRSGVGPLAGTEADLMEAVSAAFGTSWATSTEIRQAAGLPKSSVFRALNGLVARGLLEVSQTDKRGKRYRPVPDDPRSQSVSDSPVRPAQDSPTVPSSLGLGPGTKGDQ